VRIRPQLMVVPALFSQSKNARHRRNSASGVDACRILSAISPVGWVERSATHRIDLRHTNQGEFEYYCSLLSIEKRKLPLQDRQWQLAAAGADGCRSFLGDQ
jgi:hypothetical protein